MKYTLALQTPTVIINAIAKDAAGKTEQIQIEFNRYEVQEATKHLAEHDKIQEANKQIIDGTSENGTFWESSVVNEATEMKDFVRKHIVDFKKVKGQDDSGKVITVQSVKAAGDLDAYFDLLWKSTPYREALRSSCLQAIQNTASNQ